MTPKCPGHHLYSRIRESQPKVVLGLMIGDGRSTQPRVGPELLGK